MSERADTLRRYQFSLRGLLMSVTLIGLGFGASLSALRPEHLGIGAWSLAILVFGVTAIGAGLGILANRKKAGTIVGLVAALIVFLLNCSVIKWVGSTNLEVRFLIVDATTDKPIPNARVEIQAIDQVPPAFLMLSADADGVASRECPDSTCCGDETWLGLGDTFWVYVPSWRYRIIAPGFQPSARTDIYGSEFRRQVQRIKVGQALLVIRTRLQIVPASNDAPMPNKIQ